MLKHNVAYLLKCTISLTAILRTLAKTRITEEQRKTIFSPIYTAPV